MCATPIGNLEDITLRVLRTLKEVDLIAAEDTRNSIKLLNHFEIKTPMTSYHEYNRIEKAYYLIEQMKEGKKLVMELDGRPTARFMLFNGMSYLRNKGKIAYLENPYLQENLAFSFQMQVAANEYYPGLARKIYLKAYRYNLHLCPKSLLVELGAQTNTVEEIMNACDPLAHIISIVLNGQM